ncbi:MAG: T9SS type A sorting domain-containing protein [Bacteroidetes bacterium]|nr:T9SS type A sorting domain-containing protein [Bacteroidota bacterium]MBU1580429.1 T9SS type A sorting domain-containing protein [Bacteroidota bacterium]MBU2557839.1 T9SS type A sorting domain-containing protein [Bacteroidota bacterium]
MKRFLSVLTILLLIGFHASAQLRIYTPTMKAPENGEIGQMPNALLDWDAVTGQGTEILYEVQLAQEEDFSDAVTFPQTNVTALRTSELFFSETYFWRVRATDGIATSEWSEPWSFSIVQTVTITDPANASTQNPDPLLEWDEITGITHYEIQVDTAYSWRLESSGQTEDLTDIYEIDETIAWAVGVNGTLLKKDGSSWTAFTSPVDVDLLDVFFTSPDNGWVSGEDGTLLQFDGTNWSEITSGSTEDLNGLFFLSATEGYAVGNGGTMLEYDGSTWSSVDVGLTADLFAVHGIDGNNIVVAGAGANIALFDGSSWTTYSAGNRDILGIWMNAADQIWGSAKSGRIYGFDGNEWVEQTVGNRDLRDVYFLDNETGFMVGRNGTLLAYDGVIWQQMASGTGVDLSGMHLYNENSGYLVGNDGVVISYQGDGFNSDYLKDFTVSSDELEFKLANLLFGKSHYFRMRAAHDLSTSDWSGAGAFTVIAYPNLKTPANNASNTQLDLFLTWDEITGIVKYNVQVANNEAFENPLLFETSEPEYEINNLLFGTDYYWRANARHAGGVSEWSPAFKFTTLNSVTLTAPANNATDISRLPRFQWTEILGVEKYMIALDKSADFTDPELELSETNMFQHVYLLDPEETYFWRVKAIQGLDSTNWSNAWSFVTTGETAVEEQAVSDFRLYPNPATDQFQIYFDAGTSRNAKLEVYNLIGSKVYEVSFETRLGKNNELINIPALKSGMYFVKLQLNNQGYTQRLIIE